MRHADVQHHDRAARAANSMRPRREAQYAVFAVSAEVLAGNKHHARYRKVAVWLSVWLRTASYGAQTGQSVVGPHHEQGTARRTRFRGHLFLSGASAVREAVLASKALQTLDLGANRISSVGFETLLPGLLACKSLRTLEVRSCACKWPQGWDGLCGVRLGNVGVVRNSQEAKFVPLPHAWDDLDMTPAQHRPLNNSGFCVAVRCGPSSIALSRRPSQDAAGPK